MVDFILLTFCVLLLCAGFWFGFRCGRTHETIGEMWTAAKAWVKSKL